MTDFDPKNHEYATNPTYTGFGCAHCGKAKEEHTPAPANEIQGGPRIPRRNTPPNIVEVPEGMGRVAEQLKTERTAMKPNMGADAKE